MPTKRRRRPVSPRGKLSDVHAALAKRLLDPLCAPAADAKVRALLRYGYRFEGPAIVFFESRPRFDNRAEWLDHDIAKFRFTRTTGLWSLFCQYSDLRWHAYEALPHASDLGKLVDEVRRDPTHIFFG